MRIDSFEQIESWKEARKLVREVIGHLFYLLPQARFANGFGNYLQNLNALNLEL